MTEERRLGSTYVLEGLIGSGAMGQVWRGRDEDGSTWAFKVLRSDFAEDPRVVERFIQERAILTSLHHPNLVGVHDLVAEGTTLAIVMDLVPGADLRQVLTRSGTLAPAEAARLCAGVAAGLAAAHEAGVYHRDIKPENVLVDESVTPPIARLSDFGIAKLAEGDSPTVRSTMMVGTPQYMAPETADGAAPGPAADVYSLGIVLYELCCATTPFASGSTWATIKQHHERLAGRPEGVPDPLWHLVDWMLAKDPRERPPAARVHSELDGLAPLLVGLPAAPALAEPPPSLPVGAAATDPAVHDAPTVTTPWPATQTLPAVDPAAAAEPEPSTPEPPRKRRTALLVAGAVVAALVLAGAMWALFGRNEATADTPAAAPGTGQSSQPSATAGSATTASTPSDEPSTTPEETTPPPDPSAMPNLVGVSLSEVAGLLPANVAVTTHDVIEPSKVDGTVVAQDPAVGQPIPDTVTVDVARQQITQYLADLEAVTSSGFDSGSFDANGKTFAHSLAGNVSTYTTEAKTSYNLGRHYRRLAGVLGLSDTTTDSNSKVTFEVFADGRKIFAKTIPFGKTVTLDVDVTDVLRLDIVNGKIAMDGYGMAVWGDAHLLGIPGEVPTPTAQQ